jgi:predicted permease
MSFGALTYHLRALSRSPGFALSVVLTLALGIGATVALFTVVNAVLLEPLPFPDSTRLVQVWRAELPNLTFGSASVARFVDWRARQRAFTGLGAWSPQGMTLGDASGPERLNGAAASASLFTVLGAAPLQGRWFTDDEDQPGAPKVAVLGDGLWRRRFAASPAVIGTTVSIDGEPHTIVGVAPPGLAEVWRRDIWVPLARPADPAARGNNFLIVFGRLRPGTTIDTARQAMNGMAKDIERDHPEDRYSFTIWALHDVVTDGSRRGLWVLLGATSLLLAIACANVTNLFLARSLVRERDLAIRASLGAGRSRLLGLVFGETLTLGLVSSLVGLALAAVLVRVFVTLAPASFPRLAAIGFNLRVLGFAVLVSIAAGLAAGLAPALHLWRTDLNSQLRTGQTRGATAGRARQASRALIVAEMALALALLTTAGLLMRSLQNLHSQDLGLTSERVLTFGVGVLPDTAKDPEAVARFVTRFEERLRALPGVKAVGAISMLPIASSGNNTTVGRLDQVGPRETLPITEMRAVTPGYFEAMGMRPVAGRGIDPRDRSDTPSVVVVNEALAETLWPGVDRARVVGERVTIGGDRPEDIREIVGVVSNVRSRRPENPPAPEVYFPHGQQRFASMSYTVRAAGDPLALTGQVRRVLTELDPRVPMAAVRAFDEIVATSTQTSSLLSWLSSLFGLLAATLAVLGIYSVMSYTTAQRERELAIRSAVGASRSALLGLVLREGAILSVVGIAAGAALAVAGAGAVGSLLYGVRAADPFILTASAAVLALVALVGYAVPALRAARVEPVVALRGE